MLVCNRVKILKQFCFCSIRKCSVAITIFHSVSFTHFLFAFFFFLKSEMIDKSSILFFSPTDWNFIFFVFFCIFLHFRLIRLIDSTLELVEIVHFSFFSLAFFFLLNCISNGRHLTASETNSYVQLRDYLILKSEFSKSETKASWVESSRAKANEERSSWRKKSQGKKCLTCQPTANTR